MMTRISYLTTQPINIIINMSDTIRAIPALKGIFVGRYIFPGVPVTVRPGVALIGHGRAWDFFYSRVQNYQEVHMSKSEYVEKLKDPRWQKKRLEAFERDEWTCQRCGDSESTLVVHHFHYEKGKEPWEYPLKHLVTLCEDCHENERLTRHDNEQALLKILRVRGFFGDDLMGITNGFNNLRLTKPPEVFSSIIEWVLSNDDLMQHLDNLYFKWLSIKLKEKGLK